MGCSGNNVFSITIMTCAPTKVSRASSGLVNCGDYGVSYDSVNTHQSVMPSRGRKSCSKVWLNGPCPRSWHRPMVMVGTFYNVSFVTEREPTGRAGSETDMWDLPAMVTQEVSSSVIPSSGCCCRSLRTKALARWATPMECGLRLHGCTQF